MREVREKTGFSQDEFSRLTGIPIATLKRYELGINTPKFTIDQFKALVIMLKKAGYGLDDLIDL